MTHHGATLEGTAAYAARFEGHVAEGFFRRAFGLTVSSLGLGTYLGRDDDAVDHSYLEAIVATVRGGINLLDTAVNYRLQRSERVIGRALADLKSQGYRREEIVVATKGGYVPSREPGTYFREQIVAAGLAESSDLVAGCHCLAPGYIRHQLAASLRNLGLETVDIYYLHNPEQQLDEVEPDEFRERVKAAFGILEEAVTRGEIGVYGVATWNGFRVPARSPGWLSLESLVLSAKEVAGASHHFRVVQLPFNLAMPEALGRPTQIVAGSPVSLLEAARRLDIAVVTSASILQGRLSRGLPASIRDAFPGPETDAQRAIQFARSAPGVTAALVGMSRAEHVEENLGLRSVPPLPPERMAALFQS